MDPTMNARGFNRMHAAALTLATLSSFLLLTTLGCELCHGPKGPNGPDPEDLTAIAAVLNKTAGPLTVTMSDPPATDVLEPDEAIFYEVSQSTEVREFAFQSGESVATGSLRLLTGGDDPGFATGLLTVSPGEDDGTLAVDSSIDPSSSFALSRPALAPASSVFLIVNAATFSIAVEIPSGAGALLAPNRHASIVLDEGATLAVTIESGSGADAQELAHAFEAPENANGQVSAFIAFVTFQGNELAVETQNAGFRRLE
jgi:hypothetical protein